MVFWRKKNNVVEAEAEELEQELLHPQGEPALEPSTDYEADLEHDGIQEELHETDNDVIEELEITPLPDSELSDKAVDDLDVDHTEEGGWFSRMAKGLGKSTNKITQGLSDIVTKSKLDQDTLDALEEVLITADLGPKTAARVIEDFSKDRFGKDISEDEIKEALAETIEVILDPVAVPLGVKELDNEPYVLLVCGVNGAGKTTTIGKYAQQLRDKGHSVMIAAADTFRAAAIEQLETWAARSGAIMFKKDVGADAASVSFEAYEKAKADGIDVLIIDTAGRLQNKLNLMAELEKIIRVLKKKDEDIPHSTVLVLDSTTGQNAYSQVETFKDMVNVTGLIVTKLDGSAKGGVLIGLADQFGLPVHAIGVGEALADLRPFTARDYARSLMGLSS